MSSKFDTSLATAAYFIAGHGFAESEEGSIEDGGWNALVSVSRVSLMNLGAPDGMFEHAAEEMHDLNHGEVMVWIHENEAGFVDTIVRDSIGTEIREVWELRFPHED